MEKSQSPLRRVNSYLQFLLDAYLINSSRLFDKDFYLKRHPDIAKTGIHPALHYLRYGGFEGRDPGPNFSSTWYLNTYEDARKSHLNPLIHYLRYGRAKGYSPVSVEENLALIHSSGMFNETWYLTVNPDVAEAGMDAATHYLLYGGYEGRDPCPAFHSRWYLDAYKDVRKAGINPFVHYLKFGRAQGRDKGCEDGREVKVFKLERMYDYSKQTGCIVFEDAPEWIYLQRPRVIGSFSGDLQKGETFCPPVYISVIEDATIFGGSGLVVAQDEYLLSDELVDFDSPEIGIKCPLVKLRDGNRVMLEYKRESGFQIEAGILLSCDHDSNYFHWLIECLPKLAAIDDLGQFKDVPLLIPKGLHKNLEEALKKVNRNNHPIIYVEPNVAYQVQRLIHPSALSRVLDRYQGVAVFDTDIVLSHQWIAKVADLLRGPTEHFTKPWRKLYLSRRGGLRALGNREEVEAMIQEQGFEIVELDQVSLEFQIKLFSEAAMVVAPTGAALTNLLFCQPGTKVIIFMSNHETTNFYFWPNLGAINNLDITIIAGERLFTLTNYWSVHDDYIIDANLVLDQIKKRQPNPGTIEKFFLMTRGRTGSTAVIDELNKTQKLCATQELFLNYDFDKLPNFDKLYSLLPPFDLWKRKNIEHSFSGGENESASRYLAEAEMLARERGAQSFGFKLLSHHFDESPFLSDVLRDRGYQAIYLTRNLARQVLSGIIANQSGLWNTTGNTDDTRRYQIDLDRFQGQLEFERKALKEDYARLTTQGFSFIIVSYEEFCTNRQSFYERIFHFLGLPAELPPRSDWSVIIKDLNNTITNYDQVVERAAALGMPLD